MALTRHQPMMIVTGPRPSPLGFEVAPVLSECQGKWHRGQAPQRRETMAAWNQSRQDEREPR